MNFENIKSVKCNYSATLLLDAYGKVHLQTKNNKRKFQSPHSIKEITCGENHYCAIDDLGNLYTWGSNIKYKLGRLSNPFEMLSVTIVEGKSAKSVGAGSNHTIVVLSS